MKRFKIDLVCSSYAFFGLFVRRPAWHRRFTGMMRWEKVERFETRDKAREFYEKIKDLPEYLD